MSLLTAKLRLASSLRGRGFTQPNKPGTVTLMKNSVLNQDRLPAWVRWLAQDANGTWWGFEAEPHQADTSWYENEVGRYVRLETGEPNPQWRESLRRSIF